MIYSFRCLVCTSEKIIEQSIHDELIAPKCVCGNLMVQHVSPPAIRFVGKGFAKNDK